MNLLHFSENVISLRRARGMTQEQLADFVGVTKASVSKWETKQSLPDILMLPKLAACFDVTIDQLLGYEPQLSREQVQRVYSQLTAAFAEEDSFEETMSRSQELMKQYYNCYPLLFSLGTLWLNHFMLAGSKERQNEILEQAAELFRHVTEDCRDMGLCSDALIMEATTLLAAGPGGTGHRNAGGISGSAPADLSELRPAAPGIPDGRQVRGCGLLRPGQYVLASSIADGRCGLETGSESR